MEDKNAPSDLSFPLNYLYDFSQFLLHRVLHIGVVLVLVSNSVWIAVSLYCLIKYNAKYKNDLMRFAYVTLGISTMNSCMSLTEIFSENVMSSMRTLLELFQAALAIPCLATEVWLKYEVAQKEVAWLHTIIGLIPTYIFLFQHYTRQDLIDFTVVMSIISLIGVGFLYSDIYAISSAVLVFLTYCVFMLRSEISTDLAPKQIYNYCMALFTYCAYKSVM